MDPGFIDRLGGLRGAIGLLALIVGLGALLGITISLGLSKWYPGIRSGGGELVTVIITCLLVTLWVLGAVRR